MTLRGQLEGIIPSRTIVSGFIEIDNESEEFKTLRNLFHSLSNEYNFYCNHVALKINHRNSTYYIGLNDGEITIGAKSFQIEKEDSRDFIPVDIYLPTLLRKLK